MLPKITSAFLNLTNACNLACRYCFVCQNPKKISLQTAMDAADWLASNADGMTIPAINYFGGEPLLMWDEVVRPLTEYIREKYGEAFTLSMTSNCTLMTNEIASFMHVNNVGLLMSIDGAKETQDWNRPMRNGQSSFDVLDEKIPMILRLFPSVVFRSTVTPHTAHMLFENAMFAESKGFANWFIMPNCFERWGESDIATLREQMQMYTDHYIDRMRCGEKPIFFTQLERNFEKIIQHNVGVCSGSRRGRGCAACNKCGLGSSCFAGININGDLTACQEFFSSDDDFFTIGNIYTGVDDKRREKLCALWDSGEAVGDWCAGCPLDRICDGGCVANNYLISGDIHSVPSIVCEWNRILFDSAVRIMQTLGNEGNMVFKERWDMSVKR